ncbi:MAG: hypothetical protein Aureis2KO_29330 [Aureisphaera sp.]
MNTLLQITNILSVEDKRDFVGLLRKRNRRGDTKNIELFRLIDQGKVTGIDEALYGKPSRNAYHALSKRLHDSLIDFLATKSFQGETSEELDILKLLLASRIFFEHKQHKLGHKTLSKAEKKATQFDLYAILTEIYHTKIQYAHTQVDLNLKELIKISQRNLSLFHREQRLNMAYATIKSNLKSEKPKSIDSIITQAFSDFEIELDQNLGYKSLFQLMSIAFSAAQLQSDFHQIESFMTEIHGIVLQKTSPEKKHLFYLIEIEHLMANTHFRNRNFDRSIQFLMKMEERMQMNNRSYFNRFLEKLVLLKALNYNYTGNPEKALSILSDYPNHSLEISLTQIMCLFQQNEHHQAYQILKKLSHSDRWYEKKVGWIWVLKKNIIELLLLIELNRLDLVLNRMQSFERRFFKRLTQENEHRVVQFMKLIAFVYDHPKEITTADFRKKVEASFTWKEASQEDVFVMSFYAWLKSKMEQNDLYTTTLQLVAMK